MNWENLLSSLRLNVENQESEPEIGRSDFHKDCDRIIFSSAFRRLGKKTQVHPLASNDHIHTRLTHSIEVSCVGRSLGVLIGGEISDKLPSGISPLNIGEIIQAACLAHDIGNPPFGHAGEEAIRSWFRQTQTNVLLQGLEEDEKDDLLNFEGNAQSFRIVSQLEHNINEGGMRLTYATLGALLKYPWTSRETKKIKKFSSFKSEKDLLKKIANQLGLVKIEDYKWARHPLAFLVEAADDICYRILDLEDAHEMQILSYEQIKKLLDPLCKDDERYHNIIDTDSISNRRKISFLRAKAIGTAIYHVSNAFLDNYDDIMSGKFHNDLISYCSPEIKQPLDEAKSLARDKVFKHPRKIELEIGSYTTLGILLETFCNAVKEQVHGSKEVSFRSERILSMMGVNSPNQGDDLYNSYLKVMDYISGMTDNYATYMAKQIGGMAIQHS